MNEIFVNVSSKKLKKCCLYEKTNSKSSTHIIDCRSIITSLVEINKILIDVSIKYCKYVYKMFAYLKFISSYKHYKRK